GLRDRCRGRARRGGPGPRGTCGAAGRPPAPRSPSDAGPVGRGGDLNQRGLIPLHPEELAKQREAVKALTPMTAPKS
nr:hypothetical protein [Shewanella shenzhenensis]